VAEAESEESATPVRAAAARIAVRGSRTAVAVCRASAVVVVASQANLELARSRLICSLISDALQPDDHSVHFIRPENDIEQMYYYR